MKDVLFEKMVKIFNTANKKFLSNEKDLIISTVSERSWYGRMSLYLEETLRKNEILPCYVVDTEYNRNNGEIKTILDDEDDFRIIQVTCDIIVHSRGKNREQDNLICIEMKKSNRGSEDKESDRRRVKALCKDPNDSCYSTDGKVLPEYVCGYILGVYYEIDIKKCISSIEYYYKGKLKEKVEIKF